MNCAIILGNHTINVADKLRDIGDELEAEQLANLSRWNDFTKRLSGIAVCLGLLLLGTTIVKLKK
jgi:hypothetical protein